MARLAPNDIRLDCFPLDKGPARPATAPNIVGGWPITSYFGPRIDPIRGGAGNHRGQDIAGQTINLKPLYACFDGQLFQAWDSYGGGNWSTLYHPSGIARIGYGHANKYIPTKRSGVWVKAGEVIALVGTTGGSTGPHLHFAYDKLDGDTAYDDPYEPLMECAEAGRYPGSTSITPTPWPNVEGLSMADVQDLLNAINRTNELINRLHFDTLTTIGEWENDTRSVIVNGVEMIVSKALAEDWDHARDWASRDYPFCFRGFPAVFMWTDTNEGRKLEWIESPLSLSRLVQSKLNPAIQVFEPEEYPVLVKELGLIKPVTPASAAPPLAA